MKVNFNQGRRVLWSDPALSQNVVVERGGVRFSAALHQRQDKNLLSLCQHSRAQRDLIDQRTAMQEPLLHPSPTIYHAPSLRPRVPFFSPRGLSAHPIQLQGEPAHSRANDWGDIPTRYKKWARPRGQQGRSVAATTVNS